MGLFSAIGSFLGSSTFANIASTGVSLLSAYGSYSSSQEQAGAYESNAAMSQREAAYQAKRTKYMLEQHKTETDKLKGYQTTGYVKAGVRSGTGTPLDVLKDTERLSEIDANIIRYGGQLNEANALSEAKIYRNASGSAKTAGWLGVGGTLLTAPSRWVL